MFALAGGCVAVGAIFGLSFRLLFFIVILGLAVAVIVLSDLARGDGGMVLHAAIAIFGLEAGYVAGIGIRALALRNRPQRDAAERDDSGYIRLITRPKR
jgi:hypothetical protein